MGYRNYLSKINKSDYVEGKSYFDYEDDIITELYELGKDVDRELVEDLIVISDFDNDEETEFKIIDIESIPKIVSYYAKKHLNFLNSLKDGTSERSNPKKYIDDQVRRWSEPRIFIYDDFKGREKLVSSWEYQYEIFDLIRIYKKFDSENNLLIWTGH